YRPYSRHRFGRGRRAGAFRRSLPPRRRRCRSRRLDLPLRHAFDPQPERISPHPGRPGATIVRGWGPGTWGSERGAMVIPCIAFTRRGINFDFLRAVNQSVPLEKLMIAVDCLGDRVAVRGWSEVLPLTSGEALPQLEPYCSEFLCTYIDAEGKLRGTNIGWFRKLRATTRLPITAAGGITTDEEIRALEDLGMNAALGMAIYRIFFPELIAKS